MLFNEEFLLVLIIFYYFTLPDETNLKLYTVIHYTIEIILSNRINIKQSNLSINYLETIAVYFIKWLLLLEKPLDNFFLSII